jgi:hypothetical protein
LSRKCGNLDVSEPYETPRPATGIALLSFSYFSSGFKRPQWLEKLKLKEGLKEKNVEW